MRYGTHHAPSAIMTHNLWRDQYRKLTYAGPYINALLVITFTDSCYVLCVMLLPTLSAADLLDPAVGSVVVLAIESSGC